jgi:hypothetical protein
MNERIHTLAEEAGLYCDGTPDAWDQEAIQRFAQLIVNECLNNMENCDGDLDFAIWKTKQDFGVEE